jgi:hypothetical protein
VGQFPLHPEPRINATIFGAPHDSYPVQTFKKPEDAINQGAKRYSFPPPTHTQAPPHYNKPRTPLALEYTSFHANKPNQPLHKEPWTGLNSRGRTRITNVDTRQRCLDQSKSLTKMSTTTESFKRRTNTEKGRQLRQKKNPTCCKSSWEFLCYWIY